MSDFEPRPPLSPRVLERIRAERLRPSRFEPDYVMLLILREQIADALARIDHPVGSVLDVWAATQPYRELLPEHETYVSIDIDEHFGPQDVVSTEFLPFADQSFDLVMFTEAFHFHEDPRAAAAELRRVIRPGGTVLITVPYSWEYDTRTSEQRFTRMTLERVFEDEWQDIRIGENGGYSAAWAAITGRVARGLHEWGPKPLRTLTTPLYRLACLTINAFAAMLARAEARWHQGPFSFPAGLTLTARRPPEPSGE